MFAMLAVLGLLALPVTQAAPRDATPLETTTGRLSGRVLDAETGRPLRGAIVHIISSRATNPNERQGRWVTSDAEGRWELRDLNSGRYTVAASKSGYLKVLYGQQRPFEQGKTIELGQGQSVDKLDVVLPRGGAITGRVVDEFGDPVASAFVRAMRYRYAEGRRQLTALAEGIESLASNGGLTDDLGRYRLFGLSPGEYLVSAVFAPAGQSASRSGYPPTFHPGTASPADAQRVTIRIGQEAQNVDVALVPVRYATITGTVVNAAGAPANASVSLTTNGPDTSSLGGMASVTANGAFTISDVVPGEYRLYAWHGSGAPESASLLLTVTGQDISGLTLVTAPGSTVTGRVVFEGDTRPAVKLWIRASATAPGAPTFSNSSVGVGSDLTFELRGLVERQTLRVGNLPDGWFLKSITHEGVDITDTGYEFKPGRNVSGIEIALTERATTLSGTVTDDRGSAIADYTVVVFSADSARWLYPSRSVRSLRPDQDGKFSTRGLPPDDYLLVALDYLEAGQEQDPEQLEKWRTLATRVSLGDGESKSVALKLLR